MKRVALKDVIASKLRRAIISGEYRGGERLVEVDLCKHFNVSRTPVREALKQLEHELLIEVKPNHGARVKIITAENVIDLFQIIIMVDGESAKLAASIITAEQLARLEEYHYRIEQAIIEKNYDLIHEVNQYFHLLIVEAAGNPYLIQFRQYYYNLFNWMGRYTFSPTNPEQLIRTMEQHAQIIDALKSGNPGMAEFVTRQHNETGRDLLLKQVKIWEDGNPPLNTEILANLG